MLSYGQKRKSIWPWQRENSSGAFTPDDRNYMSNYSRKLPKFYSICDENAFLDINTKRVAIKASPFVVSLVTYSDDKEISQGSGTIIEDNGVILTSADLIRCPSNKNSVANNLKVIVYLLGGRSYEAQVLAHDFYYNIAMVQIQSEDVPLPKPACLRLVDDCLSLDPNELFIQENENMGFQLRPQSDTACVLTPGDQVIALGRYFIKPYDVMVAPGVYSIGRATDDDDIKEVFRTSCIITSTGAGGPLVNRYGEVIGIMLFDGCFSSFLPINIPLIWWEHFKKYKELRRPPSLGMLLSNLYAVDMEVVDKVVQKTPQNFTGVIVDEVVEGSNADVAGICPSDLIIQCCGKTIRGFLEFYDIMWGNTGKSVELVVIRASNDVPLQFSMTVGEEIQVL